MYFYVPDAKEYTPEVVESEVRFRIYLLENLRRIAKAVEAVEETLHRKG